MSPRNADPRVDRSARNSAAVLCARGQHEDCGQWLGGEDFPDVYNVAAEYRRCGCGCHVEPWPFEHDG